MFGVFGVFGVLGAFGVCLVTVRILEGKVRSGQVGTL